MSSRLSESQGVLVYHSGYGHTKRMAEAAADGANARLLQIDSNGELAEESWREISQARYIIFGSPTYMGGPSWQFKKFADASSKPWYADLWKNKIFGGLTNSASLNGDKLATLQYFALLAAQHQGVWVGMGLKPSNKKASQRNDLNRMGSFVGPMAQTPADATADEMSPGDLETARLYGSRVAEMAARFLVPNADDPQLASV